MHDVRNERFACSNKHDTSVDSVRFRSQSNPLTKEIPFVTSSLLSSAQAPADKALL